MDLEIGKIQSVVGTGQEGYAGDGGPATLVFLSSIRYTLGEASWEI